MRQDLPATLPLPHRRFIERALAVLPEDPRLLGLAAAGSFLTDSMDAFSDLDLIVVTAPGRQDEVLRDRDAIAARQAAVFPSPTSHGSRPGSGSGCITVPSRSGAANCSKRST